MKLWNGVVKYKNLSYSANSVLFDCFNLKKNALLSVET